MGEYLCTKARESQSWLNLALMPQQEPNLSFKVIELGSGTGLGGICATRLLEMEQFAHIKRQVVMTDICHKALEVIDNNVKLSGNLSDPSVITLKELAWG